LIGSLAGPEDAADICQSGSVRSLMEFPTSDGYQPVLVES
jgi:hypothetical protein